MGGSFAKVVDDYYYLTLTYFFGFVNVVDFDSRKKTLVVAGEPNDPVIRMQNVWRNIAGRRLGGRARTYSSMPRVPDQVSTPEKDRVVRFLEGSYRLGLIAAAGCLLYDGVCYVIDYNGARTWRKAAAAENEELDRIHLASWEILVAACRSSGSSRPLTYVSNSEGRTAQRSLSISPSLQRSVASSAANKVKKALGLKSKKKYSGTDSVDGGQAQKKRASTVGELMRIQIGISEQTDSTVKRAPLIAAGQLGKRVEMMVLPLELLQHFKSSDFSSQAEYEAWQKRILKILESGLLMHPYLPLDTTDTAARQLKRIIRGAYENPIDTGKHSESMKALCNVVTSLACRSFDGSVSEVRHWADGVPLSLCIYQALLESCFDVNEEIRFLHVFV